MRWVKANTSHQERGGLGISMNKETEFFKQENWTQWLTELRAYVSRSAQEGTAAHRVEKGIWERLLALGRGAFSEYLALCGDGDRGPEVEAADGRCVLRLKEPHKRSYLSIFGEFEFSRVVYGTGERKKIERVPLDEKLQLPEGKFSYLLQDWDQSLAVESPFAKVNETVERILGLSQSVDSVERVNRKMSQSVEAFWEALPVPPRAEEGELLVCSADGKGVPIRGAEREAQIRDHQPKRGPKPDRKKLALLGAVYTVERYRRTPEQIVEALFRNPGPDDEAPPARPKPLHKRIRASLIRDAAHTSNPSYEEIFGWLRREARARNPEKDKPMVLLMDGQESLWKASASLQVEQHGVEILDLVHATSYLWKAARLFYPKGSEEAEPFVKYRVELILNGKASTVIRGLRRMGSLRGLGTRKREKLDKICGYLENNRSRMNYHEYLAQGYPIASGVIEGACRNLVKDRMERSGMRWVLDGAHAMMGLRSVHLCGLWDQFTAFRIRKECARLYPNASIHTMPEALLAA